MKIGKDETRVAHNKREEKQWVRWGNKLSLGRSYAQAVADNSGAIVDGQSSNNGDRQLVVKKGKEALANVDAIEGLPSKDSAAVPEKSPENITVPLLTEGIVGAKSSLHNDLVLEFTPKDEEVAWLNRSMVAVVRSLDMVRQIQHRMDVDGLIVNVALLGGRQIILVDNSDRCLAEFIENNKELTEIWFEWVQPMSLSTISSASRLTWLRFISVPLRTWSERCFVELGGLIGEVLLVDEDTKSRSFLCEGRVLILCESKGKISATISLKVGSEVFPIEVEEEWRMDPDWWLAGERRNPITESNSEYSSEDGNVSGLNVTRFLGEDESLDAENQAITGRDSFENFEINGMEKCGSNGENLFGSDGDDLFGLDCAHVVGPAARKDVEQWAAGGSGSRLMVNVDLLQQKEVKKKESRALGAIYAKDDGIEDSADGMEKLKAVEASWVTARTKSRRDRRNKASLEEQRLEVQTASCSLSDGCIQHRNRVICQQIQLDEVRKLFVLGQRLGVKCQQNEEEVMSKLVALEERDEANFKGT
ncbi:hypothetical protein SLA2020_259290 [Shorea laevis]